jgi:hypothetical protein
MARTPAVECRRCNSLMVFVQGRGSSEGLWICPVCEARRRIAGGEQEGTHEKVDSDCFSRRGGLSQIEISDGG